MKRRGFLQALGALFAGAALPLPAETAGRYIGAKFYTRAVVLNEGWMMAIEVDDSLELEDVQIGGMKQYLLPEQAPLMVEQVRREARIIVGHDEITHTHLQPSTGPREYDRAGWVGWRADRPRVGWRERARRLA